MIDTLEALARSQELVALALHAGADAADALIGAAASESVTIRLGALEDVARSESESLALRVFVGRRSASVQVSDLSPQGLRVLAERAVAMARVAPEDAYAGLAPEEALLRGPPPDLDLVDSVKLSPAALRGSAAACEDAARSVSGVTNSNGSSAGASRLFSALTTSHGVARVVEGTRRSLSASVIAAAPCRPIMRRVTPGMQTTSPPPTRSGAKPACVPRRESIRDRWPPGQCPPSSIRASAPGC